MRHRRNRRMRTTRYLAMIGLAAGLGSGLGCGGDATGPSGAANEVYWALLLNHHAITLSLTAPGNQVQLHAAPVTANGDTIPTTNTVSYSSSDSSVIVDSTGLLTARLTSAGIRVIATLTVSDKNGQAVTLKDTALVNVNAVSAPAPVFTTLQLTTPGGITTFGNYFAAPGVTATALDASNTPLPNVNTFCQSSNPGVIDYGKGLFNWSQLANPNTDNPLPGNTTITCSATIYGVTLSNSLPIHVGMPLYGKVTIDTIPVVTGPVPVLLSTEAVKIGVGGIIQWDNRTKKPLNLVFDDSLAPQSVAASYADESNILMNPCWYNPAACTLPTQAGNMQLPANANKQLSNGKGRDFRLFSAAGTYSYHSDSFPTVKGTIVVVNN